MMNTLIVAMLLGLSIQTQGPVDRSIDLRNPGALDALASDNPGHYRKVLEIIRVSEQASCRNLPQLLRVKFDAQDTLCTPNLLLTSFPAKRHLSFRLDSTAYTTYVTPQGEPARAMPATQGEADK